MTLPADRSHPKPAPLCGGEIVGAASTSRCSCVSNAVKMCEYLRERLPRYGRFRIRFRAVLRLCMFLSVEPIPVHSWNRHKHQRVPLIKRAVKLRGLHHDGNVMLEGHPAATQNRI